MQSQGTVYHVARAALMQWWPEGCAQTHVRLGRLLTLVQLSRRLVLLHWSLCFTPLPPETSFSISARSRWALSLLLWMIHEIRRESTTRQAAACQSVILSPCHVVFFFFLACAPV